MSSILKYLDNRSLESMSLVETFSIKPHERIHAVAVIYFIIKLQVTPYLFCYETRGYPSTSSGTISTTALHRHSFYYVTVHINLQPHFRISIFDFQFSNSFSLTTNSGISHIVASGLSTQNLPVACALFMAVS